MQSMKRIDMDKNEWHSGVGRKLENWPRNGINKIFLVQIPANNQVQEACQL